MADPSKGFIPLSTVRSGAVDVAALVRDIRTIYFKTSKQTIEVDFAHAIALLKQLPTEDDRDRVAVFMEGLAEMRKEWARGAGKKAPAGAKKTSPSRKPGPSKTKPR